MKLFRQLAFSLLFLPFIAEALPLYTARSGRICDNCHSSPFENKKQQEWHNPELAERKCNLSCSTCHIEPNGGSTRRVSGRYYAQSTVAMFNTERRPYWDHKRDLTDLFAVLMPASDNTSAVAAKETGKDKKAARLQALLEKSEPASERAEKEVNLPPGVEMMPLPAAAGENGKAPYNKTHEMPPFYTLEDPVAAGTPINAEPDERTYSPIYGIYGNLNADPFIVLSANARAAYYKTPNKEITFPMHAEGGVSLHPVEHFTIAASGGVLGEARELGTSQTPVEDRLYIRHAIVMVHELPYQAYIKGGAFLPAFGIRHDDHTAPARKYFEMDYSRRNNTVYGAEIGLAPNYPYLSASVFTNMGNEFEETDGFGGSLDFGWRDLLYGAGMSFIHKERSTDFSAGRGMFTAGNLNGYLNIGRIWRTVPVTILAELVVGEKNTARRNDTIYANLLEINYLLFNGFNLKANHHFYDPDTTVKNNEIGRFGTGFDFTPFAFIKLTVEYRWAWSLPEESQWRQGILINPYDMFFEDQFMVLSHIYF